MANIMLGSIVGEIVGSVGTETYARNGAGLHVRARSNPAQPASGKRDQVQANLTAVSQAWSGRLSEAQRAAWRQYGLTYPRPNRLGQPSLTSGYLAYCRCGCAMKMINPANWIDDPPALGMLPSCPFSFLCAEAGGMVFVSITLDPNYPTWDNLNFLLTVGKTTNLGVAYYSTPWQFFQRHWYIAGGWNPIFLGIMLPAWVGVGDRAWLKAYMFDAPTGRIAVPFQNSYPVTHAKGFDNEFRSHLKLPPTWQPGSHP